MVGVDSLVYVIKFESFSVVKEADRDWAIANLHILFNFLNS